MAVYPLSDVWREIIAAKSQQQSADVLRQRAARLKRDADAAVAAASGKPPKRRATKAQ